MKIKKILPQRRTLTCEFYQKYIVNTIVSSFGETDHLSVVMLRAKPLFGVSQKWPVRVLPWPVRVLPSNTLMGCLQARARASSNNYSLVRPSIRAYESNCFKSTTALDCQHKIEPVKLKILLFDFMKKSFLIFWLKISDCSF